MGLLRPGKERGIAVGDERSGRHELRCGPDALKIFPELYDRFSEMATGNVLINKGGYFHKSTHNSLPLKTLPPPK
jgi:hypothetical protein